MNVEGNREAGIVGAAGEDLKGVGSEGLMEIEVDLWESGLVGDHEGSSWGEGASDENRDFDLGDACISDFGCEDNQHFVRSCEFDGWVVPLVFYLDDELEGPLSPFQ